MISDYTKQLENRVEELQQQLFEALVLQHKFSPFWYPEDKPDGAAYYGWRKYGRFHIIGSVKMKSNNSWLAEAESTWLGFHDSIEKGKSAVENHYSNLGDPTKVYPRE
jgi:hypothetical protein